MALSKKKRLLKQRKEEFLDSETPLTQKEAARILGCRPRDVKDEMEPSYYQKSWPKYITREVLKVRDRKVQALEKRRTRNNKMIRCFVKC